MISCKNRTSIFHKRLNTVFTSFTFDHQRILNREASCYVIFFLSYCLVRYQDLTKDVTDNHVILTTSIDIYTVINGPFDVVFSFWSHKYNSQPALLQLSPFKDYNDGRT